jgi:hypothetical protein
MTLGIYFVQIELQTVFAFNMLSSLDDLYIVTLLCIKLMTIHLQCNIDNKHIWFHLCPLMSIVRIQIQTTVDIWRFLLRCLVYKEEINFNCLQHVIVSWWSLYCNFIMYKTNDNPSNIFVYTCGLTLKWENNQRSITFISF